MAREQNPGKPKRPLKGHDKSRTAVKYGIVGYETGGWSLGWKAATGKVGKDGIPKSRKYPAKPIGYYDNKE